MNEARAPGAFLKSVRLNRLQQFRAVFTNGLETDSYPTACFFQVLQEEGRSIDDLAGWIETGKLMVPWGGHWDEIERIARGWGIHVR